MISIPVAVHNALFEWQLNLFWFNHKATYGDDAAQKARAIVIKRNTIDEPKRESMEWGLDIPHVMCESFFDHANRTDGTDRLHVPLNIQAGLLQIIDEFHDDQLIEVLDCDMFHFRSHPQISVECDEIIVCDYYEKWHLKSLSEHKQVIQRYFKHGGAYYNGGFVPIIGKAKTFKTILPEWLSLHEDILAAEWPNNIKWWAGMYALQAACERAQVTMLPKDYCYISNINSISPEQYVGHYACDTRFNKKKFPDVRVSDFADNEFYRRLRLWPRLAEASPKEQPNGNGQVLCKSPPDGPPDAAPKRTHTDVLRLIAQARGCERYLEVGLGHAHRNFDRIESLAKHWVDPKPASPPAGQGVGFRVTSDEFFGELSQQGDPGHRYDLIFVDGLHHAEQAKRDVSHALRWCSPKGAVVIHDCWPTQEEHAARDPHPVTWTGDVWKAVMQIAEESPQLDFRTWPEDYGVCILRPPLTYSPLAPYRTRDYYTWEFFLAYRNQLLRPSDWDGLWRWFFAE